MIILDAGHGGIIDGKYVTCPNWNENEVSWNKMWVHDGVPFFEGVFNRLVVDEIATLLEEENIPYTKLVGDEDVSLRKRVNMVNNIYKKDKSAILISVHGNAFNGIAKGFEVFTSKGVTRSDAYAEVLANVMELAFPTQAMRWCLTDGDKDKEANFYILKYTNCPAMLTENGFFDNPEEAKFMMSDEGINRIAQAHVDAIKIIEDAR